MKKISIVLSVIALFAIFVVPATAQVNFEGQISSRFQNIENDISQEMGFNDTLFNLQVSGEITPGVDAFVELKSSTAGSQDVDVYEAYITYQNLIEVGTIPVDAKIGRFQLDFGEQRKRGSNNASVQANSLIGNSLIDPVGSQTGLEISGGLMGTSWSFAMTNGTDESNFDENRGLAINARAWGELFPGLTASASYYSVNNDSPVLTNFGENRFALEGYELVGQGVNVAPVLMASEVNGLQLDFTYDLVTLNWPVELYMNYGSIDLTDEMMSGQEDIELEYMTFEGRYNLTPASYIALRWSQVDVDVVDVVDGEIDRLQLGVGYELAQNVLGKLEYVNQNVDNDIADEASEFDGVVGEFSISF